MALATTTSMLHETENFPWDLAVRVKNGEASVNAMPRNLLKWMSDRQDHLFWMQILHGVFLSTPYLVGVTYIVFCFVTHKWILLLGLIVLLIAYVSALPGARIFWPRISTLARGTILAGTVVFFFWWHESMFILFLSAFLVEGSVRGIYWVARQSLNHHMQNNMARLFSFYQKGYVSISYQDDIYASNNFFKK